MHTTHNESPVSIDEIAKAHVLAAKAHVDVRTAAKALRRGVDSIRVRFTRERLREALRDLEAA